MSRFPARDRNVTRPGPRDADPREQTPERSRERSGHRRNHDPRSASRSFTDRKNDAVSDVAHYRVVALTDLVKERFGGNPFAARAAIDQMKKAGLIQEHEPPGPNGTPYKILTATDAGAAEAARLSTPRGLDPGQHTWSDFVKPKDLQHDLAIYRAGRVEQHALEARGASVRRVRIDAELKAEIAARSEAARAQGGRQAANLARLQAAEELHLPVQDGKVQYPDAQLEYVEDDGVTRGHINLEVVSGHYRIGEIAAKAAAGFQMHGNGSARAGALIAAAGRLSRAVGSGGGGGGAGGAGGQGRDGLVEL